MPLMPLMLLFFQEKLLHWKFVTISPNEATLTYLLLVDMAAIEVQVFVSGSYRSALFRHDAPS